LQRDPSVRGPDYMAGRFIAPGLKLATLSKLPGVRRLVPRVMNRIVPGFWPFEIARVRYMEDLARAEVARGVRRLVILGAGFDTRAYRLADDVKDSAVFEVDHPLTGRLKRERVRKVLGALADRVTYVESTSLTTSSAVGALARSYTPPGLGPGDYTVRGGGSFTF
jgi:methyltransferase (TIGR00027 family)